MINPDWTTRGKSVAQLIVELKTFENQNMEVRISVDGGNTSFPISLIGETDGKYAVLRNCEDNPSIAHHMSEDG
ncbi:hypothetical protein ACM9XB_20440 [Xanthomonas sacchari]